MLTRMGVARIARAAANLVVWVVLVLCAGTLLFAITVPVGAIVSALGSDALLWWLGGCYLAASLILSWSNWANRDPARAHRLVRRLRPSRRWLAAAAIVARRKPVVTLESWSQPWPCPHRYGFELCHSPFRAPTAEAVRRGATCRRCGAHLFEDGRIPVPQRFRPAAEREAERG